MGARIYKVIRKLFNNRNICGDIGNEYVHLLESEGSTDELMHLVNIIVPYFIQIHASYIVNPKYIKDFDAKTVTILLNGTEEHSLPISRKFQSSFKEKYYNYLSERNF